MEITDITPGDAVYLKAADRVYDASTGRWGPCERSGPYIVERVYRSGEHYRLVAHGRSEFSRVDAALDQFDRSKEGLGRQPGRGCDTRRVQRDPRPHDGQPAVPGPDGEAPQAQPEGPEVGMWLAAVRAAATVARPQTRAQSSRCARACDKETGDQHR